MAEQRSGPDEPETELIPAVETGEGLASTRQLPAVTGEPRTGEPRTGEPRTGEPRVAPPEPIVVAADPARPTQAPAAGAAPAAPPPLPAAPMVLPPAAPPGPDERPPDTVRRHPTRSPLLSGTIGGLVVLLVAIIAVAVWHVVPHGGSGPKGGESGGSAQTLPAQISSFDPSGGSGFRRSGSDWVTQTYATAQFGNLKKGVGLVLDLGAAHTVEQVRLTGNGATVQLRAADSQAALSGGYTTAGGNTVAAGATTLEGDRGGRHRYWLVWVSRLGSAGGGFAARIGDISVRGK